MKRRMMSLLAAVMVLAMAIAPATGAWAEEDLILSVPGNDLVLEKDDSDNVLDEMNSANESILGALGKKNWEELAKSVRKTGDWREDLVAVAQSQVGYAEASDGTTIYGEGQAWTALFVNWVANKAGLTEKQFPSGGSYANLVDAMKKVNTVKSITRSNYPTAGDLALIKTKGQQLVAIVVYVNNGYASVIHGDDNGAVTRTTYRVDSNEFSEYIDLNVLMERAGIEVGKGGDVPVIPEGGVAAWTNTNAVYMRKEPTTASKQLTTLKKANTAVLVTSAAKEADGYIWYGVEYQSYTGYIRGDLLKLDQDALSAVQPTAAPTAIPTAVPGCKLCAQEANGAVLPVACCYTHLSGMSKQESYEFMCKLLEEDYITFVLYVNGHNAHVYNANKPAVICFTGCEQSIFAPVTPGTAHSVECGWYIEPAAAEIPEVTVVPTAAPTVVPAVTPAPAGCSVCGADIGNEPGNTHSTECPWYVEGNLNVQERVVDVTVEQSGNNQNVIIKFEIYGATYYEWYQVGTGNAGPNQMDKLVLSGETAHTLTVKTENSEHSYYCVATIAGGFTVTSKTTVVGVATAPIVAEAIVGETVIFTFNHSGAKSYQWFEVQGDTPTMIMGNNSSVLTLTATPEKAGVFYYCVAYNGNGNKEIESSRYSYMIKVGADFSADPEVLCKYVDELAPMTPFARYAMMQTWKTVNMNGTMLDVLVYDHWQQHHQAAYPDLLCTCGMKAPGGNHEATCPWNEGTTEPEEDLNIFKDCSAVPTECAMITSWINANASPMAIYNDLLELKATPGHTSNGVEYDRYFALLMHTSMHESVQALLCNCADDMLYEPLLVPGEEHAEDCAWHIAGVDATELIARIEAEPEFSTWAETATPAMIARALQAKTLDHLVVDGNELYVAREEKPRATIDAEGYVTDIETGFVIAQLVDGELIPVTDVPATAE